jgi:hypothetical protein
MTWGGGVDPHAMSRCIAVPLLTEVLAVGGVFSAASADFGGAGSGGGGNCVSASCTVCVPIDRSGDGVVYTAAVAVLC